jgi:S-adenosylmethionine decarboxylase
MVQNEYFDSYLLSESSLFVWPKKVILKTCGTTTLLLALSSILDMARSVGLTYVGELFYSRRNYFKPLAQLAPHSSFEDEVKFLDGIFTGSAYVLGKKNGDHWYLYLTDKDEYIDNSAPAVPGQRLPTVKISKLMRPMEPDYTLELLMTDLDEEVMKKFYKKPGVTAKSAAKSTGLAELFPEATIDDYLFDPCGYSLNGLLGDGYFTIHITPQPNCSYASFETNIECDYPALIKKVLSVFQPKNFTATLFAGHISKETVSKLLQATLVPRLLDGRLTRRTYSRYEFENNYELAFAQYDSGRKRKDVS